MKETLKGAFFVIAAMLIFGFMGIFVRFLNVPVLFIIFFDFLFTGILLIIYLLFKDKTKLLVKKYIWWLVLLAILNFANNGFYFQAFVTTTISNAVFTHYTAPIFVAIFAPFLLKEKLDKITFPAMVLSLAGLFLLLYKNFSFSSDDFIGIMFGTASGLFFALVIITIRYLSKNISVISINAYHSLFVALLAFPITLNLNVKITFNLILLILIFALIFGVAATLLHIAGIKKLKSQHVGALSYIEVLAATLYAMVFFKEIPTLISLLGGTLIMLSGYLIIRHQK